jgi:hypothetical protein
MKAIMMEFMPARSGWVSPEQQVAGRPNGSSWLNTDLDKPKPDLPQLFDGDQGTSPFWTWFIENPRND